MTSGNIYVQVKAGEINNAMPLNGSSTGGNEGGSYWINWTSNGGVTGQGWESLRNYIEETGWSNLVNTTLSGQGYTTSFEDFVRYASQLGADDNLDAVFGSWETKTDYIRECPIEVYNNCIV